MASGFPRAQVALNPLRTTLTRLYLDTDSGLSGLIFPFDWRHVLCVDNCTVPNVSYTTAQLHAPRGYITSASNHFLVSEYNAVPNGMHVLEILIGIDQGVPHASYGSTCARSDPPLSCQGQAEEDLGALSPGILHDVDLLLSTSPNVLGGCDLYNGNWTVMDMIHFTRILIEESEITCEWGTCGYRLKVKEIKTHLIRYHDIRSSPKPYSCLWNGCSSGNGMTQLSSLVRHIHERHSPVYRYWPCPTCERRFTREQTLSKHFEKCPGRNKWQVGL